MRRLLLDVSGYFQNTLLPNADEQFLRPLRSARDAAEAGGCPIPAVETTVRYAWARSMLQGLSPSRRHSPPRPAIALIGVLTHRFWA